MRISEEEFNLLLRIPDLDVQAFIVPSKTANRSAAVLFLFEHQNHVRNRTTLTQKVFEKYKKISDHNLIQLLGDAQ
jgi:hypothetical protein